MFEKEVIRTDVLVIGCGVTGLRAALAARAHGVSVTVVAKGRGASVHYDAVNAPFGHADSRDSADVYYQDMLQSGVYVNHKGLVKRQATEAVSAVNELESLGIHFDNIDGQYIQRLVSGGSFRRALYIQDRAGCEIGDVLSKIANDQKIRFILPAVAIELIRSDNRIAGALCIDLKTPKLLLIHSKAVVMAAGGIGHLYPFTCYPSDIIGQGVSLAYRAGVELVDMEFIQFEPTGVYYPEPVRGLLIPTALFGEGGVLLNKHGERFVAATPFKTETKTHKHELDLLIAREVLENRGLAHGGIHFNGTAIPADVLDSYPLRQKRLIAAGIDLKKDFVEVGPVGHSLIGGIRIDASCRGSVEGIFAAGEVSGGVHGANRMAGNAGAETIVMGKIAGESAGKYAANGAFSGRSDEEIAAKENYLNHIIQSKKPQKPITREIRTKIQTLVAQAAGVIRNGTDMEAALLEIEQIKNEKIKNLAASDMDEMIQCLEVRDMVLLGEIILRAALMRCESRGAHFRNDFPDLNDEQWLKNIIIKKEADYRMGLQVRDVI